MTQLVKTSLTRAGCSTFEVGFLFSSGRHAESMGRGEIQRTDAAGSCLAAIESCEARGIPWEGMPVQNPYKNLGGPVLSH